jgi:hypothetical protein
VWTAEGQVAASRLRPTADASLRGGSAYFFSLVRSGRTVSSRTELDGRSPGFITELGFVPRVDVHEATQTVTYTSRPAKALNDWGPTIVLERVWAHDGTSLDWRARPSLAFNFQRSTTLGAFAQASRITLRPGDVPNLATPTALRPDTWGVNASSSPRPAWSISVSFTGGHAINFAPAGVRGLETGTHGGVRIGLGLRPLTPLRIENTWLRTSLGLDEGRAFVSDILRTQWAWQFTREWSLRFIGQYDSTRADSTLSSIAPRLNFNADVLLTKLINPWTAFYLGYNGNAQNIVLQETNGVRSLRRADALALDGWQVFAKWSHLLRW